MKKSLLIVAFAMIVALGAGGCGKSDAPITLKVDDNATPTEQNAEMEKFSGSMRDLFEKGEPVKCNFETVMDGITQKSALYVSGKNMRMDGFNTGGGQPDLATHMIIKEDYQYIWGYDGNNGTKMKSLKVEDLDITKTDDLTTADIKPNEELVKLDQNMEMTCEKWSADSSMFNPPSEIEFVDYSEMMNSLGSGSLCGSCDILTGGEKDSCKANLCK